MNLEESIGSFFEASANDGEGLCSVGYYAVEDVALDKQLGRAVYVCS